MTFKIGDKVKVREDLRYGMIVDSYEHNEVVEGMLQYAGKTATITDIDDHVCYLDIDGEEWIWGKDVLEKLPDLKPVDQVIDELESERDAIKDKNKKVGQMIAHGGLDQEQNYLLAAQKHAYETVYHILNIRIRSLKKQLPAPEPVKKYNVIAWVSPQDETKRSFWYRRVLVPGELGTSTSSDNRDGNQQWTLAQIKEYGLEGCERVEVQDAE